MDFPMTKSYIAAIVARYDFYKRNRGSFPLFRNDVLVGLAPLGIMGSTCSV